MSEKHQKSRPIPTRYDAPELEIIDAINKETGIAQGEIIRRCVRFALRAAIKKKEVGFLFGDPDEIKKILNQANLGD